MRYVVALAILAAAVVVAVEPKADAQVLPPQHVGRVFLPIAVNRRPFGEYAQRASERRWRTTEDIINVMRWDGHQFAVETLRRSRGFYIQSTLRDAGELVVFIYEDADGFTGAARQYTNAPAVDVENITVAGWADHDTLRAYARSLIAECRASTDCDQSTIAWRGVTP